MLRSVLRADEWLVDISATSNASLLASPDAVSALCDEVVAAFQLTLVTPPVCHRFPGEHAGITALYLLSESHLAIHTWPEKNGALLSLGTCRPGIPERFSWSDVVRRHFGPCEVAVRRIERAIPAAQR